MGRPIEDYQYFASFLPNYTIEMFKGNEPQCIDHEGVDNVPFKRWVDHYSKYSGSIITHGFDVVAGEYDLNNNNSVWFNSHDDGYAFSIHHNTGDLKTIWCYEVVNGKATLKYDKFACKKKPYVSEAKLRRILNTKNINPTGTESVAWKIFKQEAKRLFELGDWKGEYRDL